MVEACPVSSTRWMANTEMEDSSVGLEVWRSLIDIVHEINTS